MIDLNNYGTNISIIIIYIVFFVSLIIILDEVVNITKFCYKYTYFYNYGTLNEKTCTEDKSTSIIEYEKARYRIYNIINDYKLKNDLFNKNWINYITYISILLLTIIICLGFGIYFYVIFIDNNSSCDKPTEQKDYSVLNLIVSCFFNYSLVPNCTFNYFMIFIIMIIYPLIFIFKVFFKADYTWRGGYWSRIMHMIFATFLLYYAVVLFGYKEPEAEEENNSSKYTILTIYLTYIIIFYIANYIFNNTVDEYNKPFKMGNIYDKKKDNDKNDTMFFDIYKQAPPIKPSKPSVLLTPPVDDENNNLLISFKYLTAEQLKNVAIIYETVKKSMEDLKPKLTIHYNIEPYTQVENYTKLALKAVKNNGGNSDIGKQVYNSVTQNAETVWRGNVFFFAVIGQTSAEYAQHNLTKKNKMTDKELLDKYNDYILNTNLGDNRKMTPESRNAYDGQGIIKSAYNEATKIDYKTTDIVKNYIKNLNKVNEYYKAQKDYEDDLNVYNNKYNIYKNNQIAFPKLIFIIYDILPKLIGLDKTIIIIILVAIIIAIIIYIILKYLNQNIYGNYIYNTIFIYLIGIFTIFVISNSILTYNTYFNKYLIYEPISQYKYDLNKLNTLFNIRLYTNMASVYQKLDFYKKTTNKQILENRNDVSQDDSIDDNIIIEEIKNNDLKKTKTIQPYPTEVAKHDDTLLATYSASGKIESDKTKAITAIIRRILFRVIYSATINSTITTTTTPSVYISYNRIYKPNEYYENIVLLNMTAENQLIEDTKISKIVKTFILFIKKTFINDASTLNDKLNIIKNNLKYIVYTDDEIRKSVISITTDAHFYDDYLIKKNFTKEEMDKIDYNKDENGEIIVKSYKDNLIAIDNILNIYGEFILKFRKIIIDLLNSTGYCDEKAVINIDSKLDDYYKNVFKKNNSIDKNNKLDFSFKTKDEEPKIDIYKKILYIKINETNVLIQKYFNIIKFLSLKTINTETTLDNEQIKIINEIINNYNIFNKDNDKYNLSDLLNEEFKLQCNYDNKFNNFSNNDKTEQELNMSNVSWSFIILIIIFAIILIEPTII